MVVVVVVVVVVVMVMKLLFLSLLFLCQIAHEKAHETATTVGELSEPVSTPLV